MLLNIITSCIRPRNLTQLYDSILVSKKGIDCDIRWWIILDLSVFTLSKEDKECLKSIQEQIEKDNHLKVVCIPLHDKVEAPPNVALRIIKRGLVCMLDDDNLMHPRFISRIHEITTDKPVIGVFYQQNLGKPKNQINKRFRYIDYYKVKPGLVDSAQLTVSRELIGNIEYPSRDPKNIPYYVFTPANPPETTPDGDFIAKIYRANPHMFVFIKKPLCYYNRLAPASLDLDFSD